MDNNQKIKQLRGGAVSRALLAVSLSASLLGAACTTNRTPGAGEPMRDSFIRRSPTSGISSGSETPLPPPMTSSSSQSSKVYVGSDQAAAIMATNQPPKVKVLGISNPGPAVVPGVTNGVVAGQPVAYGGGSVLLGETGELIGSSGVTAVTNSDGTTTLADGTTVLNTATFAGTTVTGASTGSTLVSGTSVVASPTAATAMNTTSTGVGSVLGSSAALPTVTGASVGGTVNGTSIGTTGRALTVGPTSTTSTGVRALRNNGRVVVTNVDGSSN